MNVDPIPKNLIAVHDLLTEAVAVAEDTGSSLSYGIALFPRAGRFEAPVFGVVTRGGESTTLTYRMLQNLRGHPVSVSGRVAAWVRDGTALGPSRTPPVALLDQPVLHLSLLCSIGTTTEDHDRTMPLESTIFAGDLKAPILLLMEERPSGWPR
ncbi:MAG: hypothetical protein HOP28_15700 [Gemmatimonadales bacterium]|nr:hypothetical protein [Gemmatimonadales bacterium]